MKSSFSTQRRLLDVRSLVQQQSYDVCVTKERGHVKRCQTTLKRNKHIHPHSAYHDLCTGNGNETGFTLTDLSITTIMTDFTAASIEWQAESNKRRYGYRTSFKIYLFFSLLPKSNIETATVPLRNGT